MEESYLSRKAKEFITMRCARTCFSTSVGAASSVQAGIDGNAYTGHLAFLGAYLALMLVLAPVASSAALKISIAR